MRLLIATGVYPPESGGPATYSKLLEGKLPERGVEVEVLPFSRVRHLPKLLRHIAYTRLVIKRARSADVVFAQDPVSVGLPVCLAMFFLHRPFMLKVVGDYAWEQGRQRFGVADLLDDFQKKRYGVMVELLRAIEKGVARRAARVIVPSDYLGGIVAGWGVKQDRLVRIYNGVDLSEKAIAPEHVPGGTLIVTSARLVPWKGIDALIDIIAKEHSWKLAIVGDGPERARLELHARGFNVQDRALFLGDLSHREALGWYQAATVFVLNSSYEGLSHVLLEAMQLSCPIVTTNVGGNPELIEDGKTGLLVLPHDTELLHAALSHVVNDALLAHTFGKRAHARAHDFSVDHMLAGIYEEIERAYKIHTRADRKGRVLMISGDRNALSPGSDVHKRLLLQASQVDWLEVYTPASEDRTIPLGDHGVVRGFSGSKLVAAYHMVQAAHSALFDVVTAQDPFLLGLIGWFAAWRDKTALQLQVHTDIASPSYARSEWANRARALLAFELLRHVDGIRVVSLRLRQALERVGVGAPVTILPIFTDVNAIKHAHRLDLHALYPHFTKFLFIAARLEKEKRVDEILRIMPEVFKEFPHTCLLIAGNGSERAELEKLAHNLDISSHVIFLGRRDDVFSLYKSVDLVIAATAPYEGYGATTVEALVAKAPVVSYDVGVAAHAGATVVLHGKLAETIIKALRTPHHGALLGELPTAEEWAGAWKRSIDVCIAHYQKKTMTNRSQQV